MYCLSVQEDSEELKFSGFEVRAENWSFLFYLLSAYAVTLVDAISLEHYTNFEI